MKKKKKKKEEILLKLDQRRISSYITQKMEYYSMDLQSADKPSSTYLDKLIFFARPV